MQSTELRDRFLSFFEARGHRRVPSDSLIPSGDPTVLFTSAGMNQFKDCFLGKRTDLSRAASCQKCLRTGDLEQVSRTPSHHSFFEMLGNFSFGDYFKAEAIPWAWEFLTRELRLPASKLWVSVYEEDDEARHLWLTLGVPDDRIRAFGQAENFWPANAPADGPNGPCGPCSELYFDRDGKVQGPNSVEVWNLVFTQYDRQPDGRLAPLPRKSIDTGMGLERLARVVQGVPTDYETDLFAPIMGAVRRLRSPKADAAAAAFAERAIADHARAFVFLLAEGLVPSNESRGYVLRMLIRRTYRLARVGLGLGRDVRPEAWSGLITAVLDAMHGSPYSEALRSRRQVIQRAVQQELEQFSATLEIGTARLEEVMQAAKGRTIAGEEAFKLYDTYGFPLELTVDVAQERGFTVDRAGFEAALAVQQERSRSASQFGEGVFVTEALEVRTTVPGLPPKDAHFIGYESLQADALVKGLWDGTAWVAKAAAGQSVGIVLDRSPFYGEAGGQIGDAGRIEGPKGFAEVAQTTWADEVLVHHAAIRQGSLSVQETVRASVDPERRLRIARSHTAAHMLHWALRKVLGPEAVQAGSYVEAERVRFDFSSLSGLREEQRHEVEALVNSRVRLADAVRADQMRLEEAKRAGALALFGEKYGGTVRVVTIGDYSKELCGGTHLAHTGFVGTFLITGESSIAAGTRRIEALVGESAARRQQESVRLLHDVARRLGRPAGEVVTGLEELLEQLKRAERDRKSLQAELAKVEAKRLVAEGETIGGVTMVRAAVKHLDREALAVLADAVKRSLPADGVVCLASEDGGAVSLVLAATPGLAKRVHAGNLLKAIAPLIGGSGGGRPDFAQGGGKDAAGIQKALQRARELVGEALEKR
ncbi:MAG: alanine--tRNA ligase [Candidatus Omnitrophica bacterium]|nr:alanine--tRNA ligase [Candidatus Omnitrophota bacterium]